MKAKKLKTLVCAHDAGGAAILAAWSRRAERHLNISYNLDGPALRIFNIDCTHNSDVDWEEYDLYITGTGWQSEFELDCLEMASANGIPAVAVLDHWVNYKARFQRKNGQSIYPKKIITVDPYADCIARSELRGLIVDFKQMPNFHWMDIKKGIRITENQGWLVALEPIRIPHIDPMKLYTKVKCSFEMRGVRSDDIRVRPHPSQNKKEIGEILSWLGLNSSHLDEEPLELSLSKSHSVVGFQTALLPLASYCGINAFSYFPLAKMESVLPQPEIEYWFAA